MSERLAEFRETVSATASVEDEVSRGKLRSTGVNLFVSIEEFLESIVSYLTWLLAGDPLAPDGLRYSLEVAREGVGNILRLPEGEHAAEWDPAGQNTLGTSLSYVRALHRWLEEIAATSSKEDLARPLDEWQDVPQLPSRPFAFPYRRLWANCTGSALSLLKTQIGDFAAALARADVAGIRNGIDHKRGDDFPSIDKLAGFLLNFERALSVADSARLYPKQFFVERSSSDRYGNTVFELWDARRTRIEIHEPSTFRGMRRQEALESHGPILVAPDGILGGTRGVLCMPVHRDSPWRRYWVGVPRVRQLGVRGPTTTQQDISSGPDAGDCGPTSR